MTPEEDFGTVLVATARKYLYVRETSSNSDNGHFIDTSLAALGLPPGNSWCAAAICAWVKETQQATGTTFKFRRSARAMGLWELNTDLRIAVVDIQPGDILCWDHGGGLGHTAVCTAAVKVNNALASLDAVAGNTSADGHSRNGDRCAEHGVTYPDPKLVGGLRIVPS